MNIHEMTESECRAMLARRNVARLACARNNQPYIVPIHVDLKGDYLYGFAMLGQKIEWMRENPLVCLETEEFNTDRQWASVVVFGHYEELPNTEEYAGLRDVAERLFQSHPMWWEPGAVPLDAREQRPRIVFRIRIGGMTGRRAETDPAKTVPSHGVERGRSHWLTQVLRRALRRRTVADPPTLRSSTAARSTS
jgi:nitroimidazol reductase NimA-like FMN-containing flavoprotein (pyridoxamine 5'-phosphate oxidase superfamily)